MPKDLKEYINVLRKYNQGVTDVDVKSYLMSIGYSADEIDRSFLELSNTESDQKKIDQSKNETLISEAQVTQSILPELPENHSIVKYKDINDLPAYEYKPTQVESIESKIDKLQDNKVNVPNYNLEENRLESVTQPNPSDISGLADDREPSVAPVTKPTIVVEDNTGKQKKHSRFLPGYVYVIVIFLLLAGFSAYVYFFKPDWFRRPPLSQENFLESLLTRAGKIEKTNYDATFSVDVTQKDPDIKEYTPSDEVKKNIEMQARDSQRFKDINNILDKINIYYISNRKFPNSLDVLKDINKVDPAKNDYNFVLESKGSDFVLSFLVESEEAKIYLKNIGLTINDSTVSIDSKYDFSKKLYMNLYAGDTNNYLGKEFNVLSSDISISLGVSGLYMKNQDENNAKFGIKGSFSGGDFNFAIDIDTIKLANDFYVKINKSPSLFGDISSVKLKWIKITQQDIGNSWSGIFNSETVDKEKEDNLKKQFVKILEVAGNTNLITYKDKPIIRNEGLNVFYDYEIKLSVDALAVFYEKVTKELESIDKENPLIKYDELTDYYLKSKVFKELYEYVLDNQSMIVTLDGEGIPISLHYKLRMIPNSDSKSGDKQVNFYFDLKLRDINTDLSIEVPEGFINFKDAYLKFTGQTEEEYLLNKQYLSISMLMQALEEYKFITGVYPENLSKLTESIEIGVGDKKNSKRILNLLPKDEYKNTDFVYKKEGDDYKIVYTVLLPKKFDNKKSSIFVTYDNTSKYTKSDSTPRVGLKFVNGENTLTSKVFSVEATNLMKVDTDKDNLSDSFEEFIGTDPKLKDTDKDGVGDYDYFLNIAK